ANGLRTPIDTYGPTGLKDLDRNWWEANKLDIQVRIEDEGRTHPDELVTAHDFDFEKEGVVFENDDVKVSALRVPHPLVRDPYAYKFETKDGKIIVFSGDTAYFPDLARFARGADILVHEVMYGPGIEALARRIPNGATLLKHLKESHTLAEDVGKIAQAAEVKTLVLSHFVPGDDPSITAEMWASPVQANFKGRIVVGKDLAEIPF
ncbi:MAG: MBL fold metallo-hydrolase, partial [Gammaproteobacteria bacterium]